MRNRGILIATASAAITACVLLATMTARAEPAGGVPVNGRYASQVISDPSLGGPPMVGITDHQAAKLYLYMPDRGRDPSMRLVMSVDLTKAGETVIHPSTQPAGR